MLVLSRKVNQTIHIGDNITIVVNHVHGNRVSLGIQAPENVCILRGELKDAANAFGFCSESSTAPSQYTY